MCVLGQQSRNQLQAPIFFVCENGMKEKAEIVLLDKPKEKSDKNEEIKNLKSSEWKVQVSSAAFEKNFGRVVSKLLANFLRSFFR
jgi:hypothetical protein